jgi:hypothetical protein
VLFAFVFVFLCCFPALDTIDCAVTHAVWMLPEVDHVVIMQRGRIIGQGTFDELRTSKNIDFGDVLNQDENGSAVASAVASDEDSGKLNSDNDEQNKSENKEVQAEVQAEVSAAAKAAANDQGQDSSSQTQLGEAEKVKGEINKFDAGGSAEMFDIQSNDQSSDQRKQLQQQQNMQNQIQRKSARSEVKAVHQIVVKEGSGAGGGESSSVSFETYHNYVQAGGGWLRIAVILIIFTCSQTLFIMSTWWLGQWALKAYPALDSPIYFWIYLGISFAYSLLILLRTMTFCLTMLSAATQLHNQMFSKILRAPM